MLEVFDLDRIHALDNRTVLVHGLACTPGAVSLINQRLAGMPVVDEPQRLGQALAAFPADRRLLLCDESGTAPPIASALGQTPSVLAVLIGPEGGFAPGELDGLRKLPFVTPVGLGPRILRADTAAFSALAVLQALVGDWDGDRPR